MRKFDANKELSKVQNKSMMSSSVSKLSNMYVPLLVVACCLLSIVGVAFSANLANSNPNTFKVKVEIVNGNEEIYLKTVKAGAFSDTISSSNSFGSINCTEGRLVYDSATQTISSPYIDRDTTCILSFMDDGVKKIEYGKLDSINDDTGVSYYFRGDAKDNYVKLNDMLFRIVRFNGDGSIRLVLNESIMSSSYGNSAMFVNSNVIKEVNNWYKTNFNGEKYLIVSDFDSSKIEEVSISNLVNINDYYLGYVGMLSAREVQLVNEDCTSSYLDSLSGLYLMNSTDSGFVYAYRNGKLDMVLPTTVLGIRPVINVTGVLEGKGTIDNPYTLKED